MQCSFLRKLCRRQYRVAQHHLDRFASKTGSICARHARCVGTYTNNDDMLQDSFLSDDEDDSEAKKEFRGLLAEGHFEDLKDKHPVHDPYDQVYSTAVFTPPVHRDFLMEDMVGMQLLCSCQMRY